MKKCDICGHINDDTQLFCGQCGNKLTNTPPPNQFSQQPPIQNNPQQNTNYQYNNNPQGAYYQPPNNGYNPQQQYPPIIVEKKKPHGCLVTLAVFGVIFLLIIILGSCGSSTSETAKTTNTTNSQTITDETTTPTTKTKNLNDFQISETTIYEDNGIIIKAISNNSTSTEIAIDFYIENNSDLSLHICIHSSAINGIMCDNNIYEGSIDVAAGKKATTTYNIKISDLKDLNIKEIQYFEFLFWAYDNAKSYKSFETSILKVPTNHFTGESYQFVGKEVYNAQGISIKKLYNDANSITFVVNNTNNYYFEYNIEDISINDWSLDTTYKLEYYSKELFPDCSSIFTIHVDNDFLQKNSIDRINSTEFKLKICPNESYFDEYSTPAIVAEFN